MKKPDLDTLALLPEDEVERYLMESGLSPTEMHLELHFIWFRRFYGFLGFENARQAVNDGDSVKAALELMQTMIEVVNSDKELAVHMPEIKEKFARLKANMLWQTEERNPLFEKAVSTVSAALDANYKPDWTHADFAAWILRNPAFNLLKETRGPRQLRKRLVGLFNERGLAHRISGIKK